MHPSTKINLPRFVVVQVIPKISKPIDIETELYETEQLITTFGGTVVQKIVQRLDHPHPSFYMGAGKLEEVKEYCKTEKIDVVVINGLVKSSQLFRIEKELWSVAPKIMVWDRIDLILNIFDQHATTLEAQLQIKLARATHMGARIYGLGKTELSRQGGGVGTRGKGETNIEFERRQIKVDQQRIKKELKKLLAQKQNRITKRAEMGIGPVALVGYTSAGKTTLFNALTGKNKEMHAGLFTTLDTVVGKLKTPNFELPILVSDTIGFIHNLPPVLIDSFKSTLLESLEAKLLLHVIDAHDPNLLEKMSVVEEILDSLKATQPTIIVLNKIDLLDEVAHNDLINQVKKHLEHGQRTLLAVQPVSAKNGINLDSLVQTIESFFSDN